MLYVYTPRQRFNTIRISILCENLKKSIILKMSKTLLFLFEVPPVWLLSCTYPDPLFLFLSLRSCQRSPLENVTVAILSYVLSHLHADTGKLLKTFADTVGHLTVCPQSAVFEKMNSRWAFQCAGRGPTVTHLNSDSAPNYLTRVIAWHWASTTHQTLPVIKNMYFA